MRSLLRARSDCLSSSRPSVCARPSRYRKICCRPSASAMPQADGSLSAVEVHNFPEAMRGTGEGHYSWDLRPKSTMTNANVDQVVTAVDGQTLTLKYKDGEKQIFVPADTPIV